MVPPRRRPAACRFDRSRVRSAAESRIFAGRGDARRDPGLGSGRSSLRCARSLSDAQTGQNEPTAELRSPHHVPFLGRVTPARNEANVARGATRAQDLSRGTDAGKGRHVVRAFACLRSRAGVKRSQLARCAAQRGATRRHNCACAGAERSKCWGARKRQWAATDDAPAGEGVAGAPGAGGRGAPGGCAGGAIAAPTFQRPVCLTRCTFGSNDEG